MGDYDSEMREACSTYSSRRKGPDAQALIRIKCEDAFHSDISVELMLFASELQLRGISPVSQPHIDSSSNVLCWNGEVRTIRSSSQLSSQKFQIFDGVNVNVMSNVFMTGIDMAVY
jgi:asparagine synthetase B (glutamine-hydrolysing)